MINKNIIDKKTKLAGDSNPNRSEKNTAMPGKIDNKRIIREKNSQKKLSSIKILDFRILSIMKSVVKNATTIKINCKLICIFYLFLKF